MIEGLRRGRPAFLASVTSADEADLALRGGAEIIDCKDPASGALGALDRGAVGAVVERVARRLPVSATIGDLPAEPETMTANASAMAATGVDIVKVGFFGEQDPRLAIAALGRQKGAAHLIAVLMADREPDFALIPFLAAHGFSGVMLDTADKSAGNLTSALTEAQLDEFVRAVHAERLLAGLAGSLQERDISALAILRPDVLGFRGALCSSGRTSALDFARIATVRRELDERRQGRLLREKSVA